MRLEIVRAQQLTPHVDPSGRPSIHLCCGYDTLMWLTAAVHPQFELLKRKA